LIVTADPSSSPMKLEVELGPNQLLPEIGNKGVIIIQLQDVNGVLARATSDILVSISSSNPSIASVDSGILIQEGQSYGQGNFYTTLTAGTTTITGSASGYATGSEVLSIQGPRPSKLVVYTAPKEIPERADVNATIIVQLQDFNGVPVRSPVDVPITVTSTNTTVGTITQQSIMIKSGDTHATTYFRGSLRGTTQITASAQKYSTGFDSIEVVRPGLADEGSFALYLAPPVIFPDNNEHEAILIQLKNSTGQIVRANKDIEVNLASSNTEVGSVESKIIIPRGKTYGIAAFRSTYAAGSTIITASGADFFSDSAPITVVGAIPHMISLSVVPEHLPSDGRSHKSIVIQLQDIEGKPVNAPSDVVISLSSTKTDIGIVDGTVVLPSGRSTIISTFYSTLVPGITVITASASGYASGSIELITAEPAPSNLKTVMAPSIIPADGNVHENLVIQLQDSSGVPARARSDISLLISSSNPSVARLEDKVILREGETFVSARLRTSNIPGSTTITVLASGFAGSSSSVDTILYPLTLVMTQKQILVNATDSIDLTILAMSDDIPVTNTEISWICPNGTLSRTSDLTDVEGSSSTTLTSNSWGRVNVTAEANKEGYQLAYKSFEVNILPLNFAIEVPWKTTPIVYKDNPTRISITLKNGNELISDANITWTTNLGILNEKEFLTDVNGSATAVFSTKATGLATISITANKEGYLPAAESLQIQVPEVIVNEENPDIFSETIDILGYSIPILYLLIISTLCGGSSAAFFLVRRIRNRRNTEFEDGDFDGLYDDEE